MERHNHGGRAERSDSQRYRLITVFQCGATSNSCIVALMDLTAGGVYLMQYGTGVRNRRSLVNVKCIIGGVDGLASNSVTVSVK